MTGEGEKEEKCDNSLSPQSGERVGERGEGKFCEIEFQ
jgi:hypothetical protein